MVLPFAPSWGGRQFRYRTFPGSTSRCFDPFSSKDVQLAYDWQYEAWVLRRFHPQTLAITHDPSAVADVLGGSRLARTVTFIVTLRDQAIEYHIIERVAPPRTETSRQAKSAEKAGARLIRTCLKEIRSKVAIYWRMDQLRQAAVLHCREGRHLDKGILKAIEAGATSQSRVHIALSAVSSQLINARLAHLHVEGEICLDFRSQDLAITRCGDL